MGPWPMLSCTVQATQNWSKPVCHVEQNHRRDMMWRPVRQADPRHMTSMMCTEQQPQRLKTSEMASVSSHLRPQCRRPTAYIRTRSVHCCQLRDGQCLENLSARAGSVSQSDSNLLVSHMHTADGQATAVACFIAMHADFQQKCGVPVTSSP